MEKNVLIVGVVLLLVGLGAGYSLRGWDGFRTARDGHMMSDDTIMPQNIDQHFIVQMIPHHEGAIEMAKIALERSKRPEIISLANDIIQAQTHEINDMTEWYESWFGSAPPHNAIGVHMDSMTGDTDDLRRVSDAEFDRQFINQMIPHHEMAVMMASMLAATTDRSEMKTLADNITVSQSREIEMMRNWRTVWYSTN